MSTPMVSVLLLGILGSFLTSYTRARAEGLGIDAQVGMLPRPERIVLLSAPQAFFGLAFGGWVLMGICAVLTVTAWITVVQRVAFVYRATSEQESRLQTGISQVNPPSTSGTEGDAFDERGAVTDGVAPAGERVVRTAGDAAARLADVAPPGDATVRRTEAGHPSPFDRAR